MTAPTHPIEVAGLDEDELVADNFPTSPKGQAILQLLHDGVSLRRVVAIGAYRRSWTAAEVAWVKKHYIDAAPQAFQFLPTGYAPVRLRPGQLPRSVNLTARQADVLDGICRGLSAAEVAAEAGLARNTADQHIRAVVRALDAEDREEAVALAKTGLVRLFIVETRGGRPSRGDREDS